MPLPHTNAPAEVTLAEPEHTQARNPNSWWLNLSIWKILSIFIIKLIIIDTKIWYKKVSAIFIWKDSMIIAINNCY